MYCSHCGKPLEAAASFCGECGAEINNQHAGEAVRLNKGMSITGIFTISILVFQMLAFSIAPQIWGQFRYIFVLINLVAACSPFIMAYYSTIQKYRNILLICGAVSVCCQLFTTVRTLGHY